jgi:hypothetical protein
LAVPAVIALAVGSGLPHAQTAPKSGSTATDPLPGASPHSKLNRQLDIFGRVLDDLLIDSEHALVQHGRNASGAYLPGYGAVFTLEFSLVGPFGVGGALAVGDGRLRLHRWDEDDVSVLFYDDDDEDEDDDKDKDKDKDDDEDKDRLRRRHRGRIDLPGIDGDLIAELDDDDLKAHRTRQYGKVKLELINTLGEYGDMIDGVPADEWVTLIARPSDLPWGERKVKRLVLRARMRDISDRAEDRISAEAFRERAVVEEYK